MSDGYEERQRGLCCLDGMSVRLKSVKFTSGLDDATALFQSIFFGGK